MIKSFSGQVVFCFAIVRAYTLAKTDYPSMIGLTTKHAVCCNTLML